MTPEEKHRVSEIERAAVEGLEQIVAGTYDFPSRPKLEKLIVDRVFTEPRLTGVRGALRAAMKRIAQEERQRLAKLADEELIGEIVDTVLEEDDDSDETETPWVEEILARYYTAPRSWTARLNAAWAEAAREGGNEEGDVRAHAEQILWDVKVGETVWSEVYNAQRHAKVLIYRAVAADVVRRYRRAA